MRSAILICTILSTCLASFGYAEPSRPVYLPGYRHRPKPTRSCSTTTISETTTSTIPPSTITQTATITETPSPVTETSTATATATATVTVSSDCDLPPATYDMGTCTYEPTMYYAPANTPPYIYFTSLNGAWFLIWDNKLFDTVCSDMRSWCNAPQSTLDRCYEARDAALAATPGQDAVDAWNSIMSPCSVGQ